MGGETSKPPPRTLLPPSFYAPAALHELLLSPGLASVFSARERRDLFESYYANGVETRLAMSPEDGAHAGLQVRAPMAPNARPAATVGFSVESVSSVSSGLEPSSFYHFTGAESTSAGACTLSSVLLGAESRTAGFAVAEGSVSAAVAADKGSLLRGVTLGLRKASGTWAVGAAVAPWRALAGESGLRTSARPLALAPATAWAIKRLGTMTLGVQAHAASIDLASSSATLYPHVGLSYRVRSPSGRRAAFEVAAEGARVGRNEGELRLSVYGHHVLQRAVYNPMEASDVVGIANGVDMGVEVVHRARLQAPADPDGSAPDAGEAEDGTTTMRLAAAWQANRCWLLKAAASLDDVRGAVVFRSWGFPRLTVAGSAVVPLRQPTTPRLGLFVEAEASSRARSVEYEIPDPRSSRGVPTKFLYEDLSDMREEASEEDVSRAGMHRRQHDVDVGSTPGARDSAVSRLREELDADLL